MLSSRELRYVSSSRWVLHQHSTLLKLWLLPAKLHKKHLEKPFDLMLPVSGLPWMVPGKMVAGFWNGFVRTEARSHSNIVGTQIDVGYTVSHSHTFFSNSVKVCELDRFTARELLKDWTPPRQPSGSNTGDRSNLLCKPCRGRVRPWYLSLWVLCLPNGRRRRHQEIFVHFVQGWRVSHFRLTGFAFSLSPFLAALLVICRSFPLTCFLLSKSADQITIWGRCDSSKITSANAIKLFFLQFEVCFCIIFKGNQSFFADRFARIACVVVFLFILDGVGVPMIVGSASQTVLNFIVPAMCFAAVLAAQGSVMLSVNRKESES